MTGDFAAAGRFRGGCLRHCGLPEKQKGPDLGPLAVNVDIANPGFPGDLGFGMFGSYLFKTSQEMIMLVDNILGLNGQNINKINTL